MSLKSLSACGLVCLFGTFVHAQNAPDPTAEIRLSTVEMNLESQNTPQIQAVNVKDKRWKPKSWLEVQVDFKTQIARTLGGREGTYPSIDIKYFLAVSGKKDKDGKQVVLSSTISYKDVPNGDCHALAFVTPATLKRLLEKENGGKADIAQFGCEITAGGKVIGGKSSTGGKWWEQNADKISTEDSLLPKDKTPFSVLWGDYDLATSK